MGQVDITKTIYKVSDFLNWQKQGHLILSPKFQRRPVWPPGAKSFLIDSLIRGLPVPIIFLRDQQTNLATLESKREVVDGQQRIRTIISYVKPELLPDLKATDRFKIQRNHNKELAGKTFDQLPADVKSQILDYEFSVHTFPASVDDGQVLQIFARMNATGLKLNNQELRNAAFFGLFKTSMYALATEQLDRWLRWDVLNDSDISRMKEVEVTSEFAMLIMRGIGSRSAKNIDKAYKDHDAEFADQDLVERRFREVMDRIDETIGDDIGKTIFGNVTWLYPLFAWYYDLMYGLGSKLERKAPKALPAQLADKVKLASKQLEERTAPANVVRAVERRFSHRDSRTTIVTYLTSL